MTVAVENKEPVVFLAEQPDGSTVEVSNDPRWLAAKMAEQYQGQMGIPADPQQALLAALQRGDLQLPEGYELVKSESSDDDDDEDGEGYLSWTVDQLKGELKARQDAGRSIDTTGIKKKSELAAALEADDAATGA